MRLLLVKTSSLGDVIHNLPVATDIRRAYPDATIDWCVEESFAGIPALHPAVDLIQRVAIRRWRKSLFSPATWQEMKRFRARLRERPYDLIIDTQGLFKSALAARAAHGPRAGYAADCAREPVAARFYDRHYRVPTSQHAVARNRQLAAAALGYAIDETRLDYGIRATPSQADWLPKSRYAVGLTATSRDDKLWPEGDWQQIIAALAVRGIATVLPAGSERERERARRIAANVPGTCVAPPLGLRELAEVLAGAAITIGVDTGLTHLSAALAIPTVALYVSTSPGLTGVVGQGFHRNLGGPGEVPTAVQVLQAIEEAIA